VAALEPGRGIAKKSDDTDARDVVHYLDQERGGGPNS